MRTRQLRLRQNKHAVIEDFKTGLFKTLNIVKNAIGEVRLLKKGRGIAGNGYMFTCFLGAIPLWALPESDVLTTAAAWRRGGRASPHPSTQGLWPGGF
jgi:hypothetical protein